MDQLHTDAFTKWVKIQKLLEVLFQQSRWHNAFNTTQFLDSLLPKMNYHNAPRKLNKKADEPQQCNKKESFPLCCVSEQKHKSNVKY